MWCLTRRGEAPGSIEECEVLDEGAPDGYVMVRAKSDGKHMRIALWAAHFSRTSAEAAMARYIDSLTM